MNTRSLAQGFDPEPPHDCRRCERLAKFRDENAATQPDWFNGPVPCFGDLNARVVIVGLAPGLKGANRTGRPFTGDYAGDLLYGTLLKFGFARGRYEARLDDGLVLKDCMIANAVRCVPPQNKPDPSEIANCRPFLQSRLTQLQCMTSILALGRIAHDQALAALSIKKSLHPFAHGARHQLTANLALYDSYHCSRYNTNTGRLTTGMFEAVFAQIREDLARLTR